MSLPVVAEPLPTSYTFGKVIGRVIHLIADTAEDTDDKPQARAAIGRVVFAPKEVIRKTTEADFPAIVLHATESANLSATGRVLDAEGRQGIWLATGIYTVTFEITGAPRAIPSFEIQVTTEHTDEAPLDLAKVAPYVPPSGVTVQTVVIPTGGTEGQVLVRNSTGGLVWTTPAVAGVSSVNGETGSVVLSAADVGAQPAGDYATLVGGTVPDNQIPASIARDTEVTAAADAAKARASHTGTQSLDTTTDSATRLAMTATERTKLTGVATGATANATDAALRARSSHTGTQAASTITGLATVATTGAYSDLSGKPTIPAPTGNDRSAVQAVIDALPAAGGTVQLAAGTYVLSGSPLSVPSNVTLAGAGRGATLIQQTTAGVPAIVSRNWLSATGTTPGGGTGVRDLTIVGATGTGAHALVLRDFRANIERVEVRGAGGHGIYATIKNDVGTALASALVENRFDQLIVDDCDGWGFYAESDGPKLTDAFFGDIAVQGNGGLGGVSIDSAAGWSIGHTHTYGPFTGPGIRIANAWNTWLHSAQVENGWTGSGISITGMQRSLHLGNIAVACNNTPGGEAVHAEKAGVDAGDGFTIDVLTVTQDNNQPVTALTWTDTASPVHVGTLMRGGTYSEQITATGGFGQSAIRRHDLNALDRSTFLDASLGSGGNSSGVSAGASFATVVLPYENFDGGGNYNPATGLYTVPADGIYQIFARVRVVDSGGTAGKNLGIGVHTAADDGAWFVWHGLTAAMRQTFDYQRMASFTAGQQLRLFTYYDGGTVALGTAALNIIRIA